MEDSLARLAVSLGIVGAAIIVALWLVLKWFDHEEQKDLKRITERRERRRRHDGR